MHVRQRYEPGKDWSFVSSLMDESVEWNERGREGREFGDIAGGSCINEAKDRKWYVLSER